MNNYSKILNQMKEKIINFSIKISKGLSRPDSKFIMDMMYGLIASSSSLLSEIARNLKESITLKKSIERLSNRLSEFKEEDRKIVWENYINIIKEKIDENTVWCVDPGDLGKKYSTKLECIDRIKDGSTGEYINGYRMIEIAGLTKEEQLPVPVYTRIFSGKEEGFESENEEIMDGLKYIENNFGKKGIYALDRWFDNKEYFDYFSKEKLNFVIRMKKNRLVEVIKKGTTMSTQKIARNIKCSKRYEYKDKYGIKRKAQTGYIKVRIPELGEREYYLVVIRSDEFPEYPMMLLTNVKPNIEDFEKIIYKVYIKRWKIEEYFKFKKQQFKFEKILVRTLNSIRTENMILSIVIGFIGIFSDKQKYIEYMEVFKASKSLRMNEEIKLVYYAIARGLGRILNIDKKGIKKIYSRENRKSEQLMLLEFTNFNCFIN